MHKEYYYITVVAGVAVADQNNQNFKHDKNKKHVNYAEMFITDTVKSIYTRKAFSGAYRLRKQKNA